MSESDVGTTLVMLCFIVTSIAGNSLVCAVVTGNRDMRIPINYLLTNLAVADIIIATFIIPKIILRHITTHPEGVMGKVLCTLLTDGNFSWVGAASSAFSMVAIAIERYYAVIYPHGNKGKLTMRKLKVILPCSWLFPLIFNIPRFLNKHFNKKIDPVFCVQLWRDKWIVKAHSLTWLLYFGLSLTLMALLYTRVVYTLWFKRNDDNVPPYQQQGVLKVRKRVTLMVVTVSAIFGICWGARVTVQISHQFTSYKFSPVVVAIANIMFMLNSAVNPFAYGLINQRFRQKIKRMICFARGLRKVHTKENQRASRLSTVRPRDFKLQDHASLSDALGMNSYMDLVNPHVPQCDSMMSAGASID